MTSIAPMHPTVVSVRNLGGEWFLRGEVADALDTSAATLRRLAQSRPEDCGPTRVISHRGTGVALYDMPTVERLIAHLAERRQRVRAGRPRLWDAQQRRRRRGVSGRRGSGLPAVRRPKSRPASAVPEAGAVDPVDVQTQVRALRAYRLRVAGHDWEDIAAQVGYACGKVADMAVVA